MASEKFCLRWNDFESTLPHAFRELREDKDFFDVTLACDDQQLQAHKVILSACSPFFRTILKRNPHAHPLLYLKGVKYVDLVAVLNFMYHGEVNVAQEELNSFLAVAEELKVKGLTQNNPSSGSPRKEPPPAPKRQVSDPVPPPPKRPRPPPPEDEEVQEVAMPSVKAEPQQYQQQGAEQVLAQVEEYGEEGYEEDYGQYEEGYAMMAQAGAEGNKGNKESIASSIQKLGDNVWQCNVCSKICARKDNIINHIENQHYPGSYKCFQCHMVFKSQNTLHVHVKRNHRAEAPFPIPTMPY